jgi:hypothetical protein
MQPDLIHRPARCRWPIPKRKDEEMKIQRQLTVFLENQPGMMDKICTVMKKIHVNILAFTLFGTVDHGVLRMIVDKPLDALRALGEKGILVIDTDVIEIEAVNKPGALEDITSVLSKAQVNVEYGYGSTGVPGGSDRFFLQVSDNKKALLVMKTKHLRKKKTAKKGKKTGKSK